MSSESLSLYYRTLSRMEGVQLLGMGRRALRERVLARLPVDLDGRYEAAIPETFSLDLSPFDGDAARLRDSLAPATRSTYRTKARAAADGEVRFLNQTVDFGGPEGIEWDRERLSAQSPLWRLKLYAFLPLCWAVRGFEPGEGIELREPFDDWLRDWMATVEIGEPGYLRNRWTPYAVSLRLLFWMRYLAWRTDDCVRENWRPTTGIETEFCREIYKNAHFLTSHVEHGVGGNHLVENGAALVAAGRLFGERSWIDHGLEVLESVAREQFCADGGHFERSPMYHVFVTTRLLTVWSLLADGDVTLPGPVREATRSAVGYLHFLRPPDDRIPLLNDAVYAQTLPLTDCLAYADAIGVEPAQRLRTDSSWIGESGYGWLAAESGALLIDGGPVGPPHLPGHSHNDLLGIHLWLDGTPIVTDTGVFEYEAGPRRDYARSVRAHNTVQVGETEPIPIGGRYLMGERTTPEARLDRRGALDHFEGAYRARPADGPGYRHHRSVVAGDHWWAIRDTVSDRDAEPVRSRLHLHPSVRTDTEHDDELRLTTDDGAVTGWLYPLLATSSVRDGWYFPEFGAAQVRDVVEVTPQRSTDTAAFGFVLSARRLQQMESTTETGGDALQRLDVGGTVHRLPERELCGEGRDGA